MIKALRAKPSLVFLLDAANIALYVFLLLRGARSSGILISALMAFVGLVFLYLCIKNGYVLANGGRESVDSNPRAFWASMTLVFGWYVVVTLSAVALYSSRNYHTSMKKEPNQVLMPTPMSVTPAADAPVVPAAGAADL